MHKSKEKLMEVFLVQLHCPLPLHPAQDDIQKLISLLQPFLCLILTCTYCYSTSSRVPRSPYHMPRATELQSSFIWLLLLFSSFSLPLFMHTWCLGPPAASPPPPFNFQFQKLISLNKALQGGSSNHLWRQGLCQGTSTSVSVKKIKKRGEGERGRGRREAV